jgi:uncharacterized delta-60 repeat protein
VAIAPDGGILVAGQDVLYWDECLGPMVVIRPRPDGTVDRRFGRRGKARVPFRGFLTTAADLAVARDGHITVSGVGYRHLDDRAGTAFTLAHLRPDGSPDRAFSGDGRQTIDFPRGTGGGGASLALRPDGAAIVAGWAGAGSAQDRRDLPSPASRFFAARYATDGTRDPSFGAGGRMTFTLGGTNEGARDVALAPDGHIILAGQSVRAATHDDFAVAEVTSSP